MDPRYRRSHERLREAVYTLAALKPVTDVQVAELSRAAGITRDTFYRHARTPIQLLAAVMDEDLRQIVPRRFPDLSSDASVDGNMGRCARALLTHADAHREVYLNAMQPRLIHELRDVLESFACEGLSVHLAANPHILPERVNSEDRSEVTILIAYAAAGFAGAIEAWLHSGLEIESGVLGLLAATPEWWFTEGRGSRCESDRLVGAVRGADT